MSILQLLQCPSVELLMRPVKPARKNLCVFGVASEGSKGPYVAKQYLGTMRIEHRSEWQLNRSEYREYTL